MAEELNSIGKLTEDQFNRVASSFQLDLIALFSILQEDVNRLVAQSIEEGWLPEELLQKIKELI